MAFALFYSRFPELAKAETRSITVLPGGDLLGLPPSTYGFLEMYCEDPGCDCRHTKLYVNASALPASAQPVATLAYGWETPDFYQAWFHGRATPQDLAEMMGPTLNLADRQSELAPALLRVFQQMVLPSPGYVERLKRHYAMFRAAVDGESPLKRARARKKSRKLRGLR